MFERKKYILEVYREKSFSRAAENLFISQPSLSATVKKEEEELGAPIFDRSINPIRLTEIVREYIRTAAGIADQEQQFAAYMDDLDQLRKGSLTIGASNLFVSYILPPLIAEYTAAFPGVTVMLREEDTFHLTERLLSDELDLVMDIGDLDPQLFDGIFFCHGSLLLTVPEEIVLRCGAEKYAMTAQDIRSNRHLLPETEPVSLSLFRNEPFLLLNEGNDTRKRADSIFELHQMKPVVRLLLDQQISAYTFADYGMGISFTGDLLVKHLPQSGKLRYFRLVGTEVERSVYFYRRRKRFAPKAQRKFLEIAASYRR